MTPPYRPLMTEGEVRRALALHVGPGLASMVLATLGLPPMTADEHDKLAVVAMTNEEE